MRKSKSVLISWIICAITFITALIFYFFLPELIPLQWGMNGEIISLGAKYHIFILAAMPTASNLFMAMLPKIDPKRESYKKFKAAYAYFRVGTTLFLALMVGLTIYSSFNSFKMSFSIVGAAVGVLIIVFGNYMPKLRHNYFCGIRTPWTLASEECWIKTHRFSGMVWMICGLLICVSAMLLSNTIAFYTLMFSVAFLVILPFAYSYYVFNKK